MARFCAASHGISKGGPSNDFSLLYLIGFTRYRRFPSNMQGFDIRS